MKSALDESFPFATSDAEAPRPRLVLRRRALTILRIQSGLRGGCRPVKTSCQMDQSGTSFQDGDC